MSEPNVIDAAYLEHQREWSRATFGPHPRIAGVLDHIRKELAEIEAEPYDVEEWADLIILAFDGAWRAGHEPHTTLAAVSAKQVKNEGRTWPDWRTADPTKAIEHVRERATPAWRGRCDRGPCQAERGHEGTCAEASGWDEP